MNRQNRPPYRLAKLLLALLSCVLTFSTFEATSTTLTSDVDIFSAQPAVTPNKPNVLIVLDNSANWSRAAQQWPSAATQGESEAKALKEVLEDLPLGSINAGLFEYRTDGSAGENDAGYVRHHIAPLEGQNRTDLLNKLTRIRTNINAPIEKRSIGNPFVTLFQDIYQYLGGLGATATPSSTAGEGTPFDVADAADPDNLADTAGYTTMPTVFRSPLTAVDSCTRTIIIFIGNNRQGQLTTDTPANRTALQAAGGDISQLPFAEFVLSTTTTTTPIPGFRTTCYTSAADCNSAASSLSECTDNGFSSCSCTNPQSCGVPIKYRILGNQFTDLQAGPATVTTTPGAYTGDSRLSCIKSQDVPAYSCPASSTSTSPDPPPDVGSYDRIQTSWASCSYVSTGATGCSGQRQNYEPRGTRTNTTTTFNRTSVQVAVDPPAYSASCYGVGDEGLCSAADFPATCSDGTYENCRCDAGDTIATGCPASAADSYELLGRSQTIVANETGVFTAGAADVMADEWARFLREKGALLPGTGVTDPVTGTLIPESRMRASTYTIDVFNAQQSPDFSALLFSMARAGGGKYYQAKNESEIKAALLAIFQEAQAVNSAFSSASLPVNATNRAQNENQVFIGVFKPDQGQEPRWFGNLKRFQLISATGGIIELGDANGDAAINLQTGFLGDCAVSFWTTDSGSYWGPVQSTDPPYALGACNSSDFSSLSDFSDLPDGPFVEKGAAAEVLRRGNNPSANPDSDGNFLLTRSMRTVTTGLANGANLPVFAAAHLPDDLNGNGVVDASEPALKTPLFNFIRGEDTEDDDRDFEAPAGTVPLAFTEPRSTIHGDVIHSRPLPVNYGDADGDPDNGISPGVVIYYGANDGTFRAVRASDGVELWSLVAPEHYTKFQRLKSNQPLIRFFGEPDILGLDENGDPIPNTDQAKDYFFDGSSNAFQNANNSKVWVFTSQRRGGRMLYGFDVTDPLAPKFLWRKGCPNLGNDTGCTNDASGNFTEMGQTWSFPNVGFIKGYSDISTANAKPVIVVGGGYNPCEDANNTSAGCTGGKGSGVYVLDAESGTLLKHFDFTGGSVAADVALIDIDGDENVDYGYAVDINGIVHRLNFAGCAAPPCDATEWTSSQIASSSGTGRKFLFLPALFQASTNLVYLALGSGDREAPLMGMYPCGGDADEDGACDAAITNRFYVFKDNVTQSGSFDLNDDTGTIMEDYTLENPPGCNANGTGTPTDTTLKCPASRGLLPSDSEKGWFIDLRDSGFPGEQGVTSAVITGGFVIFSTNRPTPVNTTACSTSLGEARGYFMNLFNASGAICANDPQCAEGGERSSVFVGGGLPPSPVVAVVPIGGVLKPIVIGAVRKDGGASSPIGAQEVRPPIKAYRTPVYWFKSGDTDTSDD